VNVPNSVYRASGLMRLTRVCFDIVHWMSGSLSVLLESRCIKIWRYTSCSNCGNRLV